MAAAFLALKAACVVIGFVVVRLQAFAQAVEHRGVNVAWAAVPVATTGAVPAVEWAAAPAVVT